MPITADQLVFNSESDISYLPQAQFLFVPPKDAAIALIRHIFRDRNDIDMMPIINGITFNTVANEYGHNIFIDVTYSKKGYRATYGAFYQNYIRSFTCYMD